MLSIDEDTFTSGLLVIALVGVAGLLTLA